MRTAAWTTSAPSTTAGVRASSGLRNSRTAGTTAAATSEYA
jgi:hypothetical protein